MQFQITSIVFLFKNIYIYIYNELDCFFGAFMPDLSTCFITSNWKVELGLTSD